MPRRRRAADVVCRESSPTPLYACAELAASQSREPGWAWVGQIRLLRTEQPVRLAGAPCRNSIRREIMPLSGTMSCGWCAIPTNPL